MTRSMQTPISAYIFPLCFALKYLICFVLAFCEIIRSLLDDMNNTQKFEKNANAEHMKTAKCSFGLEKQTKQVENP